MAELRPYEPSWRDRLATMMMGDGRVSPERRRVVEGLLGSSGLGNTGAGVADFTPAGLLFSGNEYQRAKEEGDRMGAALAAVGMIPGAGPVAREVAGGAKAAAEGIKGLLDVRPPTDNVRRVIESNFMAGRKLGDATVPIDTLVGGVSLDDASEAARVRALADKISGDNGYFSRIIVDQDGNVVEGQHRLEALRMLGAKDVPVTRIEDSFAAINIPALGDAIRGARKMPSDNVNQISKQAVELMNRYGSADKAIADTQFPEGFEAAFEAALREIQRQRMPNPNGGVY